MAVNEYPLGTYATPTGPIAQAAQDEVIALINIAKAYIPDPEASDAKTAGVSGEAPEFDKIPPEVCVLLRAEFDAAIAAIDATPVS